MNKITYYELSCTEVTNLAKANLPGLENWSFGKDMQKGGWQTFSFNTVLSDKTIALSSEEAILKRLAAIGKLPRKGNFIIRKLQ